MESLLNIISVLYAVVAAVAVAFIIWVLPVAVFEFWDSFIRPEWNRAVRNLDTFLIELKEHHQWLEWEQGRHRVKNTEHEFSTWLAEIIEAEEGKRMPVSING